MEFSDLDGDFIVSDSKKQYVFIAGGIGITPFRAILKQAEHEKKRLRVTLIYANRKNVAAYQKELETMAKRNPHFRIHYLFHPRRIDKDTIKELVPNLKTPLFYVSGPEPMVESIGKMLQQMAFPKSGSNRIGSPVILRSDGAPSPEWEVALPPTTPPVSFSLLIKAQFESD
jgi:Flavodoxin reductases (ferredoxin-NADPH reductases) family 1